MSSTINPAISSPVALYATQQASTKSVELSAPKESASQVPTADTVTISAEAKALSDTSTTVSPLSAGGTQLPTLPN